MASCASGTTAVDKTANGSAVKASPSSTGQPVATVPPAVPGTLTFNGTTLDGRPFSAASLAGRPVVLWFWAPWCATCAGQADSIGEQAARYGAKLGVVGVAGLGEAGAMRQFVADTKVGAITQLNDEAGVVWRRFKITEQSTFVLIDRAGKVVHTGWLDDQDLAGRVAALVG
jgi:thiol-disulfide isomerase/thioredoxin